MTKYIDAEKLKELVDKKWKELADKNVKVGGGKWDAEISTYLSVLRLVESLQQEQPKMDLEKEYKEYVEDDPVFSKLTNRNVGLAIAKHFFNLRFNARKEENK